MKITNIFLSKVGAKNPDYIGGIACYWYHVSFDNGNYYYHCTISEECASNMARMADIHISYEVDKPNLS